jgi:hypothetical protein
MSDKEAMVKVPEEMYRKLEQRAMRATELEELLIAAGTTLKPYRVFAVITRPVSGMDAAPVLAAVQSLVALATKLEAK